MIKNGLNQLDNRKQANINGQVSRYTTSNSNVSVMISNSYFAILIGSFVISTESFNHVNLHFPIFGALAGNQSHDSLSHDQCPLMPRLHRIQVAIVHGRPGRCIGSPPCPVNQTKMISATRIPIGRSV